jgi:hypothetical protein
LDQHLQVFEEKSFNSGNKNYGTFCKIRRNYFLNEVLLQHLTKIKNKHKYVFLSYHKLALFNCVNKIVKIRQIY